MWRTFLLILTLGACDKAPAPPEPPPADKPPVPVVAAVPTTQELLSGPRKAIALRPLPFTIQGPTHWSVNHHGESPTTGIVLLDGKLVDSELHVILAERETISPERLKVVTAYAQKERPALQKLGGDVTVRDDGETRIIDRLQLPEPQKTDPIDRQVNWRIDLFVPAGINYASYEMKILNLTSDSYKANKTLLDEVIHSLKYDAASPIP